MFKLRMRLGSVTVVPKLVIKILGSRVESAQPLYMLVVANMLVPDNLAKGPKWHSQP